MKKIDVLILKSFFKYFFLIFVISYFIILMSLMYDKLPVILSKNLGSKLFIQIIFYIAMFLTPQLSIISSVLGTILSLTNLEEDLILTAVKTLGIGIKRIFMSFCFGYLFLGVLIGLFSNFLSPHFKKKCFDIFRNLENIDPSLNIKSQIFNNDIDSVGIYVGEKNGNNLKDIVVYSHYKDQDGIESVFIAKEGSIKSDHSKKITTVNLKNGFNYCEGGYFGKSLTKKNNENNSISIRNNFENQNVYIDMKDIFRFSSFYETYSDVNTFQLMKRLSKNKKNFDNTVFKLMNDIDRVYRSIFDDLSEKKEILLKTKVLNSIKNDKFNNTVFSKADEFRDLYRNEFYDIGYFKREKRYLCLEVFTRLSLVISCLFLILISSYIGFMLKRGSLVIPIVISIIITGLYFIGDSYLSIFFVNYKSLFFLLRKSGGLLVILGSLLLYFIFLKFYALYNKIRKKKLKSEKNANV